MSSSSACWHCHGTQKCDCAFCGRSGLRNNVVAQLPGDCGFCVSREFIERNRAVLDAFDTLDPHNWEYYPPADGNKARRVFIPFKDLK